MFMPLLAAAIAGLASPAADARSEDYRFCKASEPDYGRYHLYSTVFAVPDGTYHVGIQNSFYSFANAYDGREFGTSVICFGPYDTWQEAEDQKNAYIAQNRRDGHEVSLAQWAYYGD
ncbi:MAG TPA: hypothetical protein VGR32_05150 [Brevundimonas sp.]|jgi:hypothetical protein|uniref:hypothetical protein n=1 Tax=Brevundimonas sp. TaxID=1871086 RepID=UPI002DEC1A01|nr:hypothetical protein [Brevundimonas sp.]